MAENIIYRVIVCGCDSRRLHVILMGKGELVAQSYLLVWAHFDACDAFYHRFREITHFGMESVASGQCEGHKCEDEREVQ